jgi:hypothetical protein
MRCICYSFHAEEELEDLLIDLWIRLEQIQMEAPELEIRREGRGEGLLLVWLKDDPRRNTLLPIHKTLLPAGGHAPLHQAGIFRRYGGCRAAAANNTLRATARGGVPAGQCSKERSKRRPAEHAAVGQERRYGAPTTAAGTGRRNFRNLRDRFRR